MKKTLLILFVLTLTLALSMPAMAILHYEHAAGQRIDIDAFIVHPMYWSTVEYSDDQKDADPSLKDDEDLVWQHWGDSRLTISLTSGPLTGTVQLGLPNDFANSTPVRLLQAVWAINNDTTLTIGKFYAPYYFWGNSRLGGDLGEGGYGSNWDDFDPGVALNYKGFYVYLKEPVSPTKGHANSPANDYFKDPEFDPDEVGAGADDVDTSIPRAYIGYNGKIGDKVSIMTALGYNTFKLRKESIDFDKSINAWVADLYATVKVTDMLTLAGGGIYGSNQEEMGIAFYDGGGKYSSAKAGAVINSNGDVKNTKTWAAFGEIQAKLGKVTAMTGYGYATSKNDEWSHRDNHQTYFIRAEIPIYEHPTGANITIQPEINVFDEMKCNDGTKEEKYINVGMITQVHF